MESPSIPFILSLYLLRFLPKLGNFAPHVSTSFSPAKNPAKPPLLGMLLANSARAFAATAEACTASPSIPFINLEYLTRYGANTHISFPKSIIDDPPVIHDVKPSITSAAVRSKTIAASFATASTDSAFTELSPSKKGLASLINPARFLPISGKESETAVRYPFTMLPANPPKISPN